MKKVLVCAGILVFLVTGLTLYGHAASENMGRGVSSEPHMYIRIDDRKNYLASIPIYQETETNRICTLQDEHPVYIRDERQGYFYFLEGEIITEREIKR